jgi:UDP-N-acetylmuramoyl-L-alanyl-D-glutamate--2,6-diaminopimelate ligase
MKNNQRPHKFERWLDRPLEKSVATSVLKIQEMKKDQICVYELKGLGSVEKFNQRSQKIQHGAIVVNVLSWDQAQNVKHPSCDLYFVLQKNWKAFLIDFAEVFYPLAPHLKYLGVTGTNGKTTSVDLMLQIGALNNLKGFSIGTLGVRDSRGEKESFGMTTPDPLVLRSILTKYGKEYDFCALEVSSHALDQSRLLNLQLDVAGWTNFTQDHLDYHQSMENYFLAKLKISEALKDQGKLFVPQSQEELRNKILKNCTSQFKNSIHFADLELPSPLPPFLEAKFNQDNFSLAYCCLKTLFDLKVLSPEDIFKIQPPPGRFFVRRWANRMAVVDFAHSPDALENICRSLVSSFPEFKLITLFGCGGDRDKSKRPLMAQAAARYSHSLILTSDNPRSEDPLAIIEDIEKGLDSRHLYKKMVDRKKAVTEALHDLKEGELLLIAGKGHESGIILKDKVIPYNDEEEVTNFLKDKK